MTAPKRPAVDVAADIIQTVRDHWWPTPTPPRMELDALPAELLRRLADEKDCGERRPMTTTECTCWLRSAPDPDCPRHGTVIDDEVDRLSDAAADRADTMVDRYDPDDRQPNAGDPYWAEDMDN